MTKLNLTQNEFKVLRALIENSRQSVLEISSSTGLNRNTVRSVIKSLTSNGIIKGFTVDLSSPSNQKMLIVETENPEQISEDRRIETIQLSNGHYLILSDMSVLNNPLNYVHIDIVNERTIHNDLARIAKVYCDYCGKEILDQPLVLNFKNQKYYTCCKNCKSDLLKRLSKDN
jgi:DNA-binding Lrp family transcriptional regulator